MVPDDACLGVDQREEREDQRHVKRDSLLFDDDERHRDSRILSLMSPIARKPLLIRELTAVLLQSGRTVLRLSPFFFFFFFCSDLLRLVLFALLCWYADQSLPWASANNFLPTLQPMTDSAAPKKLATSCCSRKHWLVPYQSTVELKASTI